MSRRVVITGMGWITPLGHDIDGVWAKLLEGTSGVGPTTRFHAETFPTQFSAEVDGFSLSNFLGARAAEHDGASRNTQFALAAAHQAWESAGLSSVDDLDSARVGVYLGGGEGPLDFDSFSQAAVKGWVKDSPDGPHLDVSLWAEVARRTLDPTTEFEQEPNLAAGHLAVHFQAGGPCFNTLTACAASTQAIGEASAIIRRGDADVIISGGAHTMIHPLGVTGFNRLTALSTRNDSCRTASRPFDRDRDGFVLGEGAGIVILEEEQHARDRGATILANVVGYGSTADAFRVTDIHENGRGAIAAMRLAIEDAGLSPEQIDYISAHGTGTEENDKIESLAIRAVFGDRASQVPISSIKSMLGHLIAAAGVVEIITCVLAIRNGVVPPTINYREPDPRCDLDYVPNESRRIEVETALSNSFGFGGQNDALIVTAHRAS
ncbi:MAG: beta-ketoacyl-[acyl-carrier-protein] synthase family protein [Planctomycetes bacterium]|nr:beta-ketoacyl-[acyl-carrier-protein] synthase family protein [Planctomycetota bacterium]